jgi:putative aminopeptidase FrvX
MVKKNQQLLTDKDLDWLKTYVTNPSPSGGEQNGQRLWLERIGRFTDEHWTDNYGNAVAVMNPGQEFKVVVEAHADEIAWYVKRIDDDGFIHVQQTGGTDPGIAPSQWVNIHGSKGMVPAIFGWPAIHTRDVSQDAPKESSIFLCCGCESREEAEQLGVEVGNFITYKSGFEILNGDHLVGRALDNRMGGFMLTEVARLLRNEGVQLPYSLYFINAVQEEVGMKGAKMIAHSLKPNCAFVVDVTHDTSSPMMDKNKEGDLKIGRGPVIVKAPPVHNKLRELLRSTAKEEDIAIQLTAEAEETGTDTDAFAYEAGGTPSALLSMPLRYMHTTVETMHRDDVEAAIRLLTATLKKMTPEFDFKYL